MGVHVIEAGEDVKSVVMNLGLYYTYDFTEFLGFRCPDSGLFRTDIWEKYWTDPDRWAFLVKVDGELAGFVLVGPDGTQPDSQYDVGEFFIMRRLRRRGIGQKAAFDVFDRFRGRWEVRTIVQNEPALAFWRKVVHRYTGGNCHQLPEPVTCGQWDQIVQTFDNTEPTAA
jgi:predicted acetyltransferase